MTSYSSETFSAFNFCLDISHPLSFEMKKYLENFY